jgi:hypothetical protein
MSVTQGGGKMAKVQSPFYPAVDGKAFADQISIRLLGMSIPHDREPPHWLNGAPESGCSNIFGNDLANIRRAVSETVSHTEAIREQSDHALGGRNRLDR